ncbi:SGNH/GDSL hydrolase family protein [Mucilaginibacter koreensis]
MKLINCIILTFSFFTGCAKNNMENHTPTTVPAAITVTPSADSISYLALGDSYTIGEAVSADQSFPYQLVQQLHANGYPKAQSPVIVARTGWTTDELITAINKAGINQKFDFVTLLIGVNNQYRGYNQTIYRSEFVELLNTAIRYAGNNAKRVFVISIPDWGSTPYAEGQDRDAIAQQIDQFNSINRIETEKVGANYTYITNISKQAATDASLTAGDGLHPSGKMYALWVQQLLNVVQQSLK